MIMLPFSHLDTNTSLILKGNFDETGIFTETSLLRRHFGWINLDQLVPERCEKEEDRNSSSCKTPHDLSDMVEAIACASMAAKILVTGVY